MKRALFGPGGNSEDFYLWGGKSTVQVFGWLEERGLDAYEYEAGNGLRTSAATLEKIGEEARRHGIRLSLHAPYFISLASEDEKKRSNSIEYIRQSVEAASHLGADTVVIHPGGCGKLARREAMDLARKTLSEYADKYGMCGIRLGIETMGVKKQLGTLDEVLDLCTLGGDFVPVIDFGHLNARECGGVFRRKEDFCNVFYKISEKLGVKIAENLHCHFSKIEWSGAGERRHLTFEDSTFGPEYEMFCEALADVGERCGIYPTVICESAGTQTSDAVLMKKRYLEYRRI